MEEGLELPYVCIIERGGEGGREGGREGGKAAERRRGVLRYVVGGQGGREGGKEGGEEGAAMAEEHFVELLQYMTLRWAGGKG